MQALIEISKSNLDPRVTTLKKNGIINVTKIVDLYKIYGDIELEKHISDITSALTNRVSEESRYLIYNPSTDTVKVFENNQVRSYKGRRLVWDSQNRYKTNHWALEKNLIAGVKNSLAEVISEIIATLLGQRGVNLSTVNLVVETSLLMIGTGRLPDLNLLYNPMVEELRLESVCKRTISFDESTSDRVHEVWEGNVEKLNLAALEEVNVKNALNLSKIQLGAIAKHFQSEERRNYIHDIELEAIAQTWSEHCKHNIMSYPMDDLSEGVFRGYIRKATEQIIKNNTGHICVSTFTDNAGAIWFDDEHLVCVKVETHNSPSALEPFGGAMTGILGVNRDILGFGLGAKPIANYYTFCIDDPDTEEVNLYRDSHKTEAKLDSLSILRGIIQGVNTGGNCSGIPTPQGALYFSDAFRAKPLVFVGCTGIIPAKISGKPSWVKEPSDGDLIVIAGGRTGRDGIHGATFSSSAITESNVKGTEVQLGDPLTQKKLSDAIIREARDLGLYNAITDNGAGGLSSSVGEMGRRGFTVALEKVSLKANGLSPWEIWISESQERMTFAVPKENLKVFQDVMQKHGVESSVIGEFNNSGRGIITKNGEKIFDIALDFLHDGNPSLHLRTKKPTINAGNKTFTSLEEALSDKNIRSKEFIANQYDHEVQGTSVLKPLQGLNKIFSDATAIKPLYHSAKCLGQSQDLAIIRGNPYMETYNSIEQAIRNLVTIGANPGKIALLDNFCWSDSNNPEKLWLLKESGRACHDFSIAFSTPFISGKDSMFNDFNGYDASGEKISISNAPALLITAIGIIESYENIVSLDAKYPGDLIYIIDVNVKVQEALKVFDNYCVALRNRLVASAISVNQGGRLTAIAKMVIANNYGAELSIDENVDNFARSREIIVTIAPENAQVFKEIFADKAIREAGRVTDSKLINVNNNTFSKVEELLSLYREPILRESA
ncbi:AIR synthase related, N-terminal domain protein [Neorickettsia helminthoeca str. Oregon]|uniref:Phosphoribosylformylglycinamidine synthase subunit PurL n=1 Tax=Neorickettsia helminthoeca str. Oregon TaxID=1286528 RepID=X5H547_9RICK|nr:AIR synthase-related protein [Neorickettsia helminthoeca]AHX11701.1 AIR synthase related, N-terminal domain protein [Neorickettsia helminthoeca str. Oregon]